MFAKEIYSYDDDKNLESGKFFKFANYMLGLKNSNLESAKDCRNFLAVGKLYNDKGSSVFEIEKS